MIYDCPCGGVLTCRYGRLWKLSALLLTVLSACSSMPPSKPEPIIRVQRVEVPVRVPCTTKEMLGPEPDYADSNEALKDVPFPTPMGGADDLANWFYHTKLLLAGRLQRIERDREKTIALEGC